MGSVCVDGGVDGYRVLGMYTTYLRHRLYLYLLVLAFAAHASAQCETWCNTYTALVRRTVTATRPNPD